MLRALASLVTRKCSYLCFVETEDLRVRDIWESREAFEKLGEMLYPIMQEMGTAPPVIEFFAVHNIIIGQQTAATPT